MPTGNQDYFLHIVHPLSADICVNSIWTSSRKKRGYYPLRDRVLYQSVEGGMPGPLGQVSVEGRGHEGLLPPLGLLGFERLLAPVIQIDRILINGDGVGKR
jgi:hypothetical protein